MPSRVTLVASHYMPPDHGSHADFIAPWARAVEERSGGSLAVTVHDGTSPLGRLAEQYAQVTSGTVDIAHSPAHLPEGRFPLTAVAGLPFLASGAEEGTRLLWHLLPGHLGAEYDGLQVLALHADSGGLIHTIERPVERLEDLAGLRLRAPNALVAAVLERLGAVPVLLAPPEINDALQRGALDGAALPWDVVLYTGADRFFRYHLDVRLYLSPLYFVMNRRRYDALEPAQRRALDAVSGAALLERFGGWWAAWERPGIAAVEARGNRITRLAPAGLERWRRTVAPAVERHLDGLAARGIDARPVYDAAQRWLAARRRPNPS